MSRESIFISHATPQDNDFVRWLAAKLELAGYTVWHDLARLKGGDYFWDKIEKAIREETFRLLAVVSHNSVDKSGVKDEWALGLTIEKATPGFVIPLRIDDYDFSLLPIGIHRKNVVDFFAHGWHKGLADLLDTLTDAHAPRTTSDPQSAMHWLPQLKDGAIVKGSVGEKLDSTWLRVRSMPPALETARFLGKERRISVTEINRHIPWFEHEDRIVGFAKSADLISLMSKSAMLEKSNSVDLETFINRGEKFGDTFVWKSDARKRVVNLMRQAWELAMEARGLALVELGGRRIYYVPPKLTGGRGGFIPFVDVDGRTRKKALNGRSDKRKANWNYGVGLVPSLDEPWHIELRPTIVFTDDNDQPFEIARAHRLRLSFCRNWWNDRWRTFLRAFLALVSGGQSEIRLPVGSERFLVVDASPMMYTSPIGLTDGPPAVDADVADEDDSDGDWDNADDGIDDQRDGA